MTQRPIGRPKQDAGFANFDCDENEGMRSYTFAKDVFQSLGKLGLGADPERPRLEAEHAGIWTGLKIGQYFDGRLPTVIRKLSLDQLSALYSLYANWYRYLVNTTQKVATERSEALRKKEFMWSHVRKARKEQYISETGKKLTDQAASDEARGDVRFVHVCAEYEKANHLYEILLAMCEVSEQDMKVISREVTIQQEAYRQKLIGNSFGNRGNQDWSQAYGGSYGTRQAPVVRPDSVQAQEYSAPEDPVAFGTGDESPTDDSSGGLPVVHSKRPRFVKGRAP